MLQKILIAVIVFAVIGAGSFFGGMKYSQSKQPAGRAAGNFQDFQNLSDQERQQKIQDMGANIGSGAAGAGNRFISRQGGLPAGEIIAKDENSITVKQNDGSTKIIFFSDLTSISKSAEGSLVDLQIGQQVSVSGSVNDDGSTTAQLIQIRPNL